MEEFAEIEPAGFTIEFTPMEDGGCVVSGGFPESFSMIPNRCIRTVQVVVNNAGTVLELDSIWNSPFLRTHATYLVSDREGLFGRVCPSCKSYFRTNCMKKKLICPYCSWKDENGAFTTENQKRFMFFCFKARDEAMTKRVKTVVDLGDAAKALPNNKPAWVYTEENQQHTFSCNKCKQYNANIIFNILGEFGNCPSCGKRNYALVFESKMQLLQRQFTEKDAGVKEPQRRSEEWKNLLVRCVSEFESLANDMRKQLLRIPSTQKRKNDLASLSFQRVLKAHECLKYWYGIEILGGFSDDDSAFLNKMFNRRHLVIHTGSRVDEEYLKNTKDPSVRLNQVIRVDSQEIRRLIALTKTATQNLISGYDSIQ
jgi:Zn finger protein HypA/HybF involved in hydrogenase expression